MIFFFPVYVPSLMSERPAYAPICDTRILRCSAPGHVASHRSWNIGTHPRTRFSHRILSQIVRTGPSQQILREDWHMSSRWDSPTPGTL